MQKQGFEVLRSLSASNSQRKAEICDERTIDLAKSAMVALRHDARVASGAIGMLGNLTCANADFKKVTCCHFFPSFSLISLLEVSRG